MKIDPINGVIYGNKGQRLNRLCTSGYQQVYCKPYHGALAHRVIWESVHGPIPAGMQINHINGVKDDNRIANLELVTPSANTSHAYRLGLRSAKGECNGRAILSPDAVLDIRRSSVSQRSLAREYGVSPSTIRDIRTGKNWRHVA